MILEKREREEDDKGSGAKNFAGQKRMDDDILKWNVR
jgi:hypothetical protein